MAQSISEPTSISPLGGSSAFTQSELEHGYIRAEESALRSKSCKGKWRLRQRDGGGADAGRGVDKDDHGQGASFVL